MNSPKLFHIFAIANNLVQYDQMKSSFLSAGFTYANSNYTLFDNSNENTFDPYHIINTVKQNSSEEYILYCHQDILLNQGDGYEQLVELLQELDEIDPRWAIAGNAGLNQKFRYAIKITDLNNALSEVGPFPKKVHSLDENFLIVKTNSTVFCSSELSGFHFYAHDLCLNAIARGYSCYVIKFHLTHLSFTKFTPLFWEGKSKFHSLWSKKFIFCYIKTVTGFVMCLSKYPVLRFMGSIKWVRKVLFLFNHFYPFLSPYNKKIL